MMLFGLISDVHANHPALRAVLGELQGRGAERPLVAGDLVGYGGQPNECVELLAEVEADCVAGHQDLFVLDRLPPTRFPTASAAERRIDQIRVGAGHPVDQGRHRLRGQELAGVGWQRPARQHGQAPVADRLQNVLTAPWRR